MMTEFKQRFEKEVKDLRTKVLAGTISVEDRFREVERISSEYTYALAAHNDRKRDLEYSNAERTGRKPKEVPFNPPDSSLLDQLSDLLLHEDLTDRTPYKIANNEYPFMNARMMERRKARDVKASALEKDQERKAEGRRRMRSPYEHALQDRTAKIRNTERRKKYNDFVNGKTPGVFSVDIKTGVKRSYVD